ncbi:hypothetical protein EMPS_03826 [Entomortierella parvispora]|uniref:F-box domain-containing protein n=1 Tax=Entomortierella parvispora TaxID=205924 RepID=A0A9P3H7H3_9FUNG|nr:hypothetical protein EMPS_03826 [Entomortierella parvispora]
MSMIASYLSKTSFLACIQVSSSWYRCFRPRLWQDIELQGEDYDTFNFDDDTFDKLWGHAKMIKSLKFTIMPHLTAFNYLDGLLRFPRLRRLVLDVQEACRGDDDPRVILKGFIQANNRHLVSLRVLFQQESRRSRIHFSVWDILQGFKQPKSRLTNLDITDGDMIMEEMDNDSRRVLMQLRSLKRSRVDFSTCGYQSTPSERELNLPQRLTDCNIHHLALQYCRPGEEVYQLLEDYQEIRSLEWVSANDLPAEYFSMWLKGLRAGYWSFLESLDLCIELKDSELAQLLEAVAPLNHFTLSEMEFGELSSVALLESGAGKQRMKLETLSLSMCLCPEVDGSMVQRFLCEMPQLRILRAPMISAWDIELDPRPWICKNIEEHSLAFVLASVRKNLTPVSGETAGETTAEILTAGNMDLSTRDPSSLSLDLQPQPPSMSQATPVSSTIFLDRLATLTHLRALLFENVDMTEYERVEYLKIRLDCGLDRLKALRRLTELNLYCETGEDVDLEEAQWMLDHWPMLTKIRLWSLHPDVKAKAGLCELFERYWMDHRHILGTVMTGNEGWMCRGRFFH